MPNETDLETAREIFLNIKTLLSRDKYQDNISEFETALKRLITQYDTSNWENRFVVGGAVEILFCAFLNSIGLGCERLKETTRYDLCIKGIDFSLKSNFTGSGDIRLINILGGQPVPWQEPTIFFISGLGICYADPQMGLKTSDKRDAAVINVREIKALLEDDDRWAIPIDIPRKPKSPNQIRVASYDVARAILEEIGSKYLKNHLPTD